MRKTSVGSCHCDHARCDRCGYAYSRSCALLWLRPRHFRRFGRGLADRWYCFKRLRVWTGVLSGILRRL